jgi:hypothetical protein
MKHKDLMTVKLEQLDNALTMLNSLISTNKPSYEVKDYVGEIKERVADLQTLINNESDSWN